MRQIKIGDITIDAVIERDGPWRRPQDFFPAYDEATFRRHLPAMEPEVFDPVLGMMFITYQTFVVRTPHHTILVDTCTGEDKGHPPPFDFPGKERWRKELFGLGLRYEDVDYVFCTHLHIDHTGWNTTLARRPLGADLSQCEVRVPQGGIRSVGSGGRAWRQPPWDGISG